MSGISIWQKLLRNPRFMFGLSIVGLLVTVALFAPWLATFDLQDRDITRRLLPPNAIHFFGCDIDGADIFSGMVFGARTSLYVGILTVLSSLVVGVFIGIISGYYGGLLDISLMRLCEIFMAFPGILLALTLTTLMGPSTGTIIFAIAATGWTSSARIARAQVLTLKEREYIMASRTMGAPASWLITKHILPNLTSPLLVHATFSLSSVIVVEAGLSFLGLGSQDTTATWGAILGQGTKVDLMTAPHVTLIPGAAIFLLVIALNFIGDALRDILDPKLQMR